jgi:acetate kinase
MSMGFTPVSGIMMSTRSGDIEPGVLTYLETEKGMTPMEISDLVTNKSGLLGVSETTADMHTLLGLQDENPKAKLAIELFCYQIKKTIGAYAAALGGVDSIIFSGGIGERSAEIRARICSGLEFMGVVIDDERNSLAARLISGDGSTVGVHVIPAHEDNSIATQTINCISKEQS